MTALHAAARLLATPDQMALLARLHAEALARATTTVTAAITDLAPSLTIRRAGHPTRRGTPTKVRLALGQLKAYGALTFDDHNLDDDTLTVTIGTTTC